MTVFTIILFAMMVIFPIIILKIDFDFNNVLDKYLVVTMLSMYCSFFVAFTVYVSIYFSTTFFSCVLLVGFVPFIIFICEYVKKRKSK